MNALLKPVLHNAKYALYSAALDLRRRERRDPEWVALGPDVELPKGSTGPLGLLRVQVPDVRPDHLMVGIGEIIDD